MKGKKDTFLSNSTNEHCMINVISTEVKKAGCYVFHSLYDADVDIELSFLEFSTTVIGEDADLCYYCIMQTLIQNHCTLKVVKSQTKWKFVTL